MSVVALKGRGTLTGKTRLGKTTLARRILSREPRTLIIDPKWCFEPLPSWEIRDQEYNVTQDAEDVGRLLDYGHVIYHPKVGANRDDYEDALRSAWDSGRPHTLYVDETAMLCNGPLSYPAHLQAYWQQGGQLGLKALSTSQRPSGLPVFIFSESEQHWMFNLLLKRDRERAAEWIGDEARMGTNQKHSFWYRDVDADRPREYILDLGGG